MSAACEHQDAHTRRARTIGLADCTPRVSPRPLGYVLVVQSVRTTSRAPVHPSRLLPAHPRVRPGQHPAHVRPFAYAPGEVPTLRTRRPLPAPFPGIPEPAAPQPRESPPLWRNVGPTLGSFRRLAVQLPKTLWAIPMGLLDSLSNMWGVRHHDSPPVSEWCS